MTNAHIMTAANNLQRAAQDVRDEKARLQADITRSKQQALTSIKMLKTQSDELERRKRDPRTTDSEKTAVDRQQKNIKNEIAEIEKNTAQCEQESLRQINAMEGQEGEFSNLANHLGNIA